MLEAIRAKLTRAARLRVNSGQFTVQEMSWLVSECEALSAMLHDLKEESNQYLTGLRKGRQEVLQRAWLPCCIHSDHPKGVISYPPQHERSSDPNKLGVMVYRAMDCDEHVLTAWADYKVFKDQARFDQCLKDAIDLLSKGLP